ncbi:MAG: hypothetical protein AAF530_02240 [Pseudomonadota bacterium]
MFEIVDFARLTWGRYMKYLPFKSILLGSAILGTGLVLGHNAEAVPKPYTSDLFLPAKFQPVATTLSGATWRLTDSRDHGPRVLLAAGEESTASDAMAADASGGSSLRQMMTTVLDELDQLTAALEKAELAKAEAEAQLAEQKKLLDASSIERARLGEQLTTARQQVSSQKEKLALSEGVANGLKNDLSAARQESKTLQSGLDSKNAELAEAQSQIATLTGELEKTTAQSEALSAAETEVQNLSRRITDSENQLTQSQSRLSDALQAQSQLEADLDTAKQGLSESEAEKQAMIQILKASSAESNTLKQDLEQAQAEQQRLTETLSKTQQDLEQIAVLQAEIVGHRETAAAAQEDLTRLNKHLSVAQGDNEKLRGALTAAEADKAQLSQDLASLKGESEKIAKMLIISQGEVDRLTQAVTGVAEKEQALVAAKQQIQHLKVGLTDANTSIGELQSDFQNLGNATAVWIENLFAAAAEKSNADIAELREKLSDTAKRIEALNAAAGESDQPAAE